MVLVANPKAVIPGVSTNAVGKNYRVSHKIGMGSFGEIYLGQQRASLLHAHFLPHGTDMDLCPFALVRC
jgi:hypothetical protein